MGLFLLMVGLPLISYYLFTGIFDVITGYKKEKTYNFKPDNITNIHHHHNTHNHLHVDKKDLTEMMDSNKSNP